MMYRLMKIPNLTSNQKDFLLKEACKMEFTQKDQNSSLKN